MEAPSEDNGSEDGENEGIEKKTAHSDEDLPPLEGEEIGRASCRERV